jgi:hypothetical protein
MYVPVSDIAFCLFISASNPDDAQLLPVLRHVHATRKELTKKRVYETTSDFDPQNLITFMFP